MGDGRVRIAHEDLRVRSKNTEIEVRQDANRIVAADGRDHGANRSIGKGLHEVIGPGSRIRRDPRGVTQGVARFNDAAVELLLELPLSRGIPIRIRPRSTPRQRHRRDGVARTQAGGGDGRYQR
jgi:hypothetical protein